MVCEVMGLNPICGHEKTLLIIRNLPGFIFGQSAVFERFPAGKKNGEMNFCSQNYMRERERSEGIVLKQILLETVWIHFEDGILHTSLSRTRKQR